MVIARHSAMTKIALALIAGLFFMSMLVTVVHVAAANPSDTSSGRSTSVTERPTFRTGIGFIEDVGKGGGYETNAETTNLRSIIGAIIRAALTLIGGLFLIMMVYGGYSWMTDRGDSEKVKTAKDTITRAIIGLIIVMGAYAITNFITGRLVETAAGPIEAAPPADP